MKTLGYCDPVSEALGDSGSRRSGLLFHDVHLTIIEFFPDEICSVATSAVIGFEAILNCP